MFLFLHYFSHLKRATDSSLTVRLETWMLFIDPLSFHNLYVCCVASNFHTFIIHVTYLSNLSVAELDLAKIGKLGTKLPSNKKRVKICLLSDFCYSWVADKICKKLADSGLLGLMTCFQQKLRINQQFLQHKWFLIWFSEFWHFRETYHFRHNSSF